MFIQLIPHLFSSRIDHMFDNLAPRVVVLRKFNKNDLQIDLLTKTNL